MIMCAMLAGIVDLHICPARLLWADPLTVVDTDYTGLPGTGQTHAGHPVTFKDATWDAAALDVGIVHWVSYSSGLRAGLMRTPYLTLPYTHHLGQARSPA